MRIKHPSSFVICIALMIMTGFLTVSWTVWHFITFLLCLILIGTLRGVSHWEARRERRTERVPFTFRGRAAS